MLFCFVSACVLFMLKVNLNLQLYILSIKNLNSCCGLMIVFPNFTTTGLEFETPHKHHSILPRAFRNEIAALLQQKSGSEASV